MTRNKHGPPAFGGQSRVFYIPIVAPGTSTEGQGEVINKYTTGSSAGARLVFG